MFSEPNFRIVLLIAALGAILFFARSSPEIQARYRNWRNRRERMRWFADEFLPDLISTAKKTGSSALAARVVQSPPQLEVQPPPARTTPVSPAAKDKLEEMMKALPQSERERLAQFVRSQS